MTEELKKGTPCVIYAVPPNVDSKTWADIQSKQIDVRLKEIEVEREKIKAFIDLAREGMKSLKDYYLRKIPRATVPAYILIATIVIGATILTWLDKVGGETFAFLMGTVVGYIISLLAKHT